MTTRRSLALDSDQLRQVIEVGVTGVQRQIVLQHECSNPNVVCGNGRVLAPKLPKDRRIVMRRLSSGNDTLTPGCIMNRRNVRSFFGPWDPTAKPARS